MRYFVHSIRFSKTKPEDFGLEKSSKENIYINKFDNSEWIMRNLLDFGWGSEIGFCRLPQLEFEKLFQLVINWVDKKNRILSDDDFNFYGGLAILLEDYSSEFVKKIDDLVSKKIISKKGHSKMFELIKSNISFPEDALERISDKKFVDVYYEWKKVFQKLDT